MPKNNCTNIGCLLDTDDNLWRVERSMQNIMAPPGKETFSWVKVDRYLCRKCAEVTAEYLRRKEDAMVRVVIEVETA